MVLEGIYVSSKTKWIEIRDKHHKRKTQVIILFSRWQQWDIDSAVVVSGPLWEIFFILNLDFYVVGDSPVVNYM